VIITAYFDESGTHKDAPLTAMAGYVGDQQQWQEFNVRVRELFADFGVRQFHLVDLRHSDKDFAGWSIEKKIQLTVELQHIANETLESGVTVFLSEETYQKHYCSLDWPRKVRRDTKYCILFRACMGFALACMGFALDRVLRTERWAPLKELRVVLEDGHKNAQGVETFYNSVRRQYDGKSGNLAPLRFANKDCLPIASADLIAGSALRVETGGKPIGTARHPTKADVSYRGNLWRVFIERETLLSLYNQAVDGRAHRR
jgi:hypothetical protein